MRQDDEAKLARLLADVRLQGRQLKGLPVELTPADAAQAYRVSALVAGHLGWPVVGWKMAATNADMQRRLRSDGPIFGRVFAPFLHEEHATIERASLLSPLIECEFVFRLGKDLEATAGPFDREAILDAAASVHAAIEVAECRYENRHLPPLPGVLADNSGSGHLVIGPANTPFDASALKDHAVTLFVDDEVAAEGSGAAVFGDPLEGLLICANWCSSQGIDLAAGSVISTGTTTGMEPGRAGKRYRGDFGTLGSVEVEIT